MGWRLKPSAHFIVSSMAALLAVGFNPQVYMMEILPLGLRIKTKKYNRLQYFAFKRA